MSEADHFLEDARRAFRLAANAMCASEMERHAGLGREYLSLAHAAAKLIDTQPTFWPNDRMLND